MPILPPGALLTFAQTSPSVVSASVAVREIKYKTIRKAFTRVEFMGDRLRSAPNIDGSMPIFNPLPGFPVRQYLPGCNPDETDRTGYVNADDARVDNILKRFDIKHYEIVGDISLTSEVDAIFNIAKNHSVLQARFDAFMEEAKLGGLSFTRLVAMQAETFSYLTSTTLSMSGPAMYPYSGETNLLIIDYTPDVASQIWNDSAETSSTVYKAWSMVIEQWTYVPAKSLTY